MRCTCPGPIKYDTDLMSVAFHSPPGIYHDQYEAVHRDQKHAQTAESIQRVTEHFGT